MRTCSSSNVRTPLAQDLGTVVGQARIDLRHRPVARLGRTNGPRSGDVLVQRQGFVRECGEFPKLFHADESAADDDKPQVARCARDFFLSARSNCSMM
jgi:hypothetical protein